MKKLLKTVSLLLVLCLAFAALAACGNKSEDKKTGDETPLKDNYEEAEKQIKTAFQAWINETFGDKIADSKITVEKIYNTEEEQKDEMLKDYKLGPNEVAFEVYYELKPAEGVDPNLLISASGDYDAESGWVKELFNLGVLRPSDTAESGYIVTNIGTGW